MDQPCPNCSTPAPDRATFCPRCGAQLSGVFPSVGDKKAWHRREMIVGWILFIVGGAMGLLGLFYATGGRAWMSVGLGIALFVVGLGTLVGKPDKPKKKKKREKKPD